MDSMSSLQLIQRVRHEIKVRDVVVSRIRQTGTHLLSITFHGEALADFVSLSFDDHIKFIFPGATGEEVRRDYTPTGYDKQCREITLEFALHAEGAATDWARQARVGMPAKIAGPRSSMVIPMEVDWHVLVGDLSALPAMTRRMEELPASAQVKAIIEIGDDGDIRQFATAAQAEVIWVKDKEALLAALRALTIPEGTGYAWAAGEAQVMKQVREIFVTEKQLPKEVVKVSAYWKPGASDFHENLEQ